MFCSRILESLKIHGFLTRQKLGKPNKMDYVKAWEHLPERFQGRGGMKKISGLARFFSKKKEDSRKIWRIGKA